MDNSKMPMHHVDLLSSPSHKSELHGGVRVQVFVRKISVFTHYVSIKLRPSPAKVWNLRTSNSIMDNNHIYQGSPSIKHSQWFNTSCLNLPLSNMLVCALKTAQVTIVWVAIACWNVLSLVAWLGPVLQSAPWRRPLCEVWNDRDRVLCDFHPKY